MNQSPDEPEHIRQLRDSLRRMLDREVPPQTVAEWDRHDRIPRGALSLLAEIGACAIAVPEDHGGAGVDVPAVMAVVEELARRSTALCGLYVMNAIYGSFNVQASGSIRQRQDLLPSLAAGDLIFAYGLSEPDVGADLASVKTQAVRRGDRIVLNGSKRWCSGADIADYIWTLVRTGPTEQRRRNLSILMVPARAPGISITSTGTMGMRGIRACDVVFEGVELPLDGVVGGDSGWNQGWSLLAGPTLEAEKLQVPAMGVGMAHAALDEAWQYAQERSQFGSRICAHQAVRHLLVDAQTQLLACRLMLRHATAQVAAGTPAAADTSMAKLFVSETARHIVLECQRVLGAYGYAEGFQMERLVRDVLVLPIWGGSSNIQRNNIANLLHLPRD